MSAPGGITARLRRTRSDFTLDVELEVPGSGVTALFGPSGAGKTTLLRAIAGLDPDVKGELTVNGETWQDTRRGLCLPAHRRPVGFVFQDADLFPHLDVRGNLDYGSRRVRNSKPERRRDDVVALLGLGPLLDRRPDTLSGGERRRAAIARALLVDPAVLLLDEPLSGLDAARRREILPWLERLHREAGLPILYVSHDVDEVARLADHLVVLESGRVSATGGLGAMLARLDSPLRLGEEAGVVLEAVVGARDEAWRLCRADFPGGGLWLPDHGKAPGTLVRVRVLARDVSLALAPPQASSILNALPGRIDGMTDDTHAALALVRVRVGDSALLARVTRRSAATLDLTVGREVWAQVKSAAVIE